MRRMLPVVFAVIVLIVLLLPVHTRCGARSAACAMPPDESGRVGYYYEVEPLGITVVETLLQQNFRIAYSSGTERVDLAQ
ncbi:MAG: hypothetical protein H7Z42_07505 [Roseiflexaceae bacterium]|nr:hypothetical protein [Roseiflexaceae bacterium]